MITTPLLKNTEAKQRWSYIAFTVLCVALALLCWAAIGGTKSFPVSEETRVGPGASASASASSSFSSADTAEILQPVLKPDKTWVGLEYLHVPSNSDVMPQKTYDVQNFGGEIDEIDGRAVWTTKAGGLTVYHGSNKEVDPTQAHGLKSIKGIWMSPDFLCSLAGAAVKSTNKGGTPTIVEFTLQNGPECLPFLLLGIGAKHNAAILFQNHFRKSGETEGYVTMGRPSIEIRVQLENFCNENAEAFCGWRSPFDQNEVFICNRCTKACLKSTGEIHKFDPTELKAGTVYWFPGKNLEQLTKYDPDGKDLKAGEKAQERGDTLAFWMAAVPPGGEDSQEIEVEHSSCDSIAVSSVADDDFDQADEEKSGCKPDGTSKGLLKPVSTLEENDPKSSSSTK